MGPEPPVLYAIDRSDRLVHVNPAWSAAAEAAAAPMLAARRVIGRSLWDFVDDATTRALYGAVLERARGGARPLSFNFRCDTPTHRRLMNMRITGLEDGAVSFEVRVVATQVRPRVALLEPGSPRQGLIRMCGWCKRLPLPTGEWVEVETALSALDLLDASPPPAITHGMCPECHRALSRAIERDELGGGDVTLGELPPA